MAVSPRIEQAFSRCAGKSALIPYICAGDPSVALTVPLMHTLVKAGADIIELGIPFSDPMADGPVIQQASERALTQGVGLVDVLRMVKDFRQDNQHTPVVLMGYANPIEVMGYDQFVTLAHESGVDGVLIVDMPPQEYGSLAQQLQAQQIAPIFLLAPTSTPDRIAEIAKIASGYVYYVSLRGVTGAGTLDTQEVQQRVRQIKQVVSIPVGVGFGIQDAQSAAQVAQVADAVVIGSKLIQTIHQAATQQQDVLQVAHQWLAQIKAVL